MPARARGVSVLIVSTLAFTVCFMVWTMFGVIGIPIRKTLGLNATEFGLLTATPILTGSLIRVPLGIWTDKYGGRIVLALLMAFTVPAIWLMSYATAYWHFLVIGLFVGLAGGSFSVGTPYVARWFPKNRQGFAMGVFGAGNSGAAVNKFVAPALVVAFGWTLVPQVYAAVMLGTLVLFWMFSASGLSGLYLVQRLDLWERFAHIEYCWMHAMVLVWGVFTLMLFVLEPLFLHRWWVERAARDPDSTFALIVRLHWVLLGLSLVTVAGAVAGSHGFQWFNS